jgi:DNA invertase Pin-like site-specific DNA recombinase
VDCACYLVSETRSASLEAKEQSIGTSTAAGKCFLNMLGVFTEFETNLGRERRLEGIANAKANPVPVLPLPWWKNLIGVFVR